MRATDILPSPGLIFDDLSLVLAVAADARHRAGSGSLILVWRSPPRSRLR